MHQVVYQEKESIEIGIDGNFSREEFAEVVHQLESLRTTYTRINVMFDLTNMDGYDKAIAIDEFAFYREHKDALRRVAVVADGKVAEFFTAMYRRFGDVEVKHFGADELEDARKWTFGSRLP